MAAKVTEALTGAGIWGVEFFLSHDNGVYFSELSPRPHDTGMVTLAGTQNLNEFELHLRAVLGLPIPEITQERIGASAVILSPIASKEQPRYRGEEEVCKETNTYLRILVNLIQRLTAAWELWYAMLRMEVTWMHFVTSVKRLLLKLKYIN